MLLAELFEASLDFKALKNNKIPLTDEERDECLHSRAIWHHGPGGAPSPAVWKSKTKSGKLVYVTNTHRCYQIAPTLHGAIKKYHTVVKDTA